ncbi:hypothetical protein M1P56_18925 [Streptomyces sp. HU2014]|uniref:Uncharacterized protein n=1 Tax=Streptomyces albireticuli TaxID=1940 RepID=A0A1Z2KVC7_9ACTN|nr:MULTISPECIES: hypothetical protein [Streptomyces]ARZ66003.1 hypothetical protein SMD11_0337 [Streptomyces albireticuli]UQI46267.1 hypothetical protein M1P56_18925 [Streptomyces sp. HU2014]
METSELLGVLCRELPELRAVAEETGDGDGLEEVLAAARRGEPVDERLRALGLLRLLESSTTRAAPAGGEQAAGLVSLPGDRVGHVALGRYRCPAGACRRAEQPSPGEDLPVCALHARPLRFG